MATANFRTQNNFPLFATNYFDAQEYEDEETGETVYDENSGYFLLRDCEREIEKLNRELHFYRLELRDGYYSGVQLYLSEQHDGETTDGYTREEWRDNRREASRYPGNYYYWEFARPYSEQKRAEQREREKIERFCRGFLREIYDFHEYGISARFSNGETWYSRVAA